MGKKNLITIFFLLIVTILSFSNQKKLNPSELPEKYRKWLEEEVVYIITPTETQIQTPLKMNLKKSITAGSTTLIDSLVEEHPHLGGGQIWVASISFLASLKPLNVMKT